MTLSGKTSATILQSELMVNGEILAQGSVISRYRPLDLSVNIVFDPLDQGDLIDVFVVALYDGQPFMKDNGGNWQPWNGQIDGLTSYRKTTAGSSYMVDVVQGLTDLPGLFEVFVGYQSAAGELIYNQQPILFRVN